MRQIALTNSAEVALVDDNLYDQIMANKWLAHRCVHTTYVLDTKGTGSLHRYVAKLLDWSGDVVDHKDGDGLNNQVGNLRPCTRAQNAWNSFRRLGASGHPGVHRNRSGWAVRFECDSTRYYFGTHRDLDVAKAIATREMARLRGEFIPVELQRHLAQLESNERSMA